MRSGRLFRLPRSVPRTSATGCSSSPTLRASEWNGSSYQRDRGEKGRERPTLHGLVGMTPTLTAAGFGCVDVDRLLERRAECAERHGNNGFGLTLEQFMAIEEAKLPTLTASDHYSRAGMRPSRGKTNRKTGYLSEMMPTLNAASGDKGPRKTATKAENGGHQVNLIDVTARLSGQGGGVLNPRWCEWYMGFPDDWCDLPSADSATPSSPSSPSGSADA